MFGGSLSVTVPWAESWQFPDDLHVCIEPSRTANAGTERRRAWAFCVIPAWAPRGSSGRQDSLSLGGVTGQGTSGEGEGEGEAIKEAPFTNARMCSPADNPAAEDTR